MAIHDLVDLRSTTVAAAGTTQADATKIQHKHSLVATVAAGAGVVLQQDWSAVREQGTIFNGAAATALLVYPWSGASFNGQTADLPLTLPAGAGCHWVYFSTTNIGVIFS